MYGVFVIREKEMKGNEKENQLTEHQPWNSMVSSSQFHFRFSAKQKNNENEKNSFSGSSPVDFPHHYYNEYFFWFVCETNKQRIIKKPTI